MIRQGEERELGVEGKTVREFTFISGAEGDWAEGRGGGKGRREEDGERIYLYIFRRGR